MERADGEVWEFGRYPRLAKRCGVFAEGVTYSAEGGTVASTTSFTHDRHEKSRFHHAPYTLVIFRFSDDISYLRSDYRRDYERPMIMVHVILDTVRERA